MISSNILEATSKSNALKMSKSCEEVRSDSYISSYEPRNWYTSKGASKMLAYYNKKGFPNCSNFRLITLTVDNKNYKDGEDAYERTKGQVRRFVHVLRKAYGDFECLKKLEFTKLGFPHWHLILSINHKINLELVNKAWGRGRVNVERVEKNTSPIDYCCKYLQKPGGKDGFLPPWVLDYPRKIRFFEHSRNFFLSDKKILSLDENNKASDLKEKPATLDFNKLKYKINSLISVLKPYVDKYDSINNKPFRTIREKLNSWQNSFSFITKREDRDEFYRIPIYLKYGYDELVTMINQTSKKYLFKFGISAFNNSFLNDGFFTAKRINSLRLKNFELFAFLVANEVISIYDLPFFISQEITEYLCRFEFYKKIAVKDKFIKFEYVDFFDEFGNVQGYDELPISEHWDKFFEIQRETERERVNYREKQMV